MHDGSEKEVIGASRLPARKVDKHWLECQFEHRPGEAEWALGPRAPDAESGVGSAADQDAGAA
jgi:hypothetical protein